MHFVLHFQIWHNQLNAANADSDTAFHLAARLGDLRSVELLKTYSADATITNDDEETPLTIAEENNFHFIVVELSDKHNTGNLGELLNDNDLPGKDVLNMKAKNSAQLNDFADDILAASPDVHEQSNIAQLQTLNTARLGDIASEVYQDLADSVHSDMADLVDLEDWLEKKQHSPPHKWMKRWVMLKDSYLLWSDRQISVQNGVTAEEKRRWNGFLNLHKIESVKAVDDKQQRSFSLTIKKMKREYVWRASSTEIRDKWVGNLQERIEFTKRLRMFSSYKNLLEM